ncbi:MAG: redoxin domain-containing protein [Phycisphaerae bacterium]
MRSAVVALGMLTALSGLAAGQSLGSTAPSFEMTDTLNAEKITLEKFRGRIVVIVFWRTTDSGAMDLVPMLNTIHKSLSRSGVVVIAVTPEEKSKAESIIKGKEATFMCGFGGDVHEKYKVEAYPRAYLIDTHGTIVWRGHPNDGLEDRVKEQLNKTPTAVSGSGALRGRYEQAQKFFDEREYGRAYTIAKWLVDVAGDDSIGERARDLVKSCEEKADSWLNEGREKVKDEPENAARIIAEISVRFEGVEIGRKADDEVAKLRGEAKTKNIIRKAIDNVRGEMRNAEAADQASLKQYLEAIEIYRDVTEKYKDTPAAAAAQKSMDDIRNDPKTQQFISAARANDQADRWLDIGNRYAKIELYDLAREEYEKILKEHPRSIAATKAKEALKNLPEPKPEQKSGK